MYSLELHPTIVTGTHPNPIYASTDVAKIRVEITRIGSMPIIALGQCPLTYENYILEQMPLNAIKNLAMLIDKNVVVVKKDGVLQTSADINKLSFHFTLAI